jgi:hypothetical protein
VVVVLAPVSQERHVEEVQFPLTTAFCERLGLADIETLTPRDLVVVTAALPLRVLALTCRLSDREFTQRARAALTPELQETFDQTVAQRVRASEAFGALAYVMRTVCALVEQGEVVGPVGVLELPGRATLGARVPGRCRHGPS